MDTDTAVYLAMAVVREHGCIHGNGDHILCAYCISDTHDRAQRLLADHR